MVRRQESVTSGIQQKGQKVTNNTATVTHVIQSGPVTVRVRTLVFIQTGHCGSIVGSRDMNTIGVKVGNGTIFPVRLLRELLWLIEPCFDAGTVCF
jgi:hypothetical protein